MDLFSRPPPTSDFVTAYLSGDLIEALDRYILENGPGINRSEALGDAFRQWCTDRGYLRR